MNVLLSIIIPILTALLGAWGGRKYDAFVLNRQEKAILVLFLQEFALLLCRTKLFYKQMIDGGISFSTLFEASDASTFVKLAEVSKNSRVIDRALKLKADFFQVIRYANKASEAAAKANSLQTAVEARTKELETARATQVKINAAIKEEKQAVTQYWIEAKIARGMAINFFMGDRQAGGVFKRNRYADYIENMKYIINYLESLNSYSPIFLYLLNFTPRIRKEKQALDDLVSLRREELTLIKEILELLREKERTSLEGNRP
jgi:hypothetical protein